MPQASQRRLVEFGLLVLLSFLWGGSFTLVDVAVGTVPPATIVTGRLAIAAALLMLLVRLRALAVPTAPATWGAFSLQGAMQSALPFTLISWGQQHIDSGLAGLLNSTPPLFTFLILFFLLREKVGGLRSFIGVVCGFAGVVVTLGADVLAGLSDAVLAQLAVIGASFCYAVAPIIARRFVGQPALVTAAGSMTMATLLMLPVALTLDRPWTLAPSPEAVWSILGLGVFSTALAMVIYFRLVRTLGALSVTSGSYLRAGFSLLLGVALLGEQMSANLIAGLVLILFGVALVNGRLYRPTDRI